MEFPSSEIYSEKETAPAGSDSQIDSVQLLSDFILDCLPFVPNSGQNWTANVSLFNFEITKKELIQLPFRLISNSSWLTVVSGWRLQDCGHLPLLRQPDRGGGRVVRAAGPAAAGQQGRPPPRGRRRASAAAGAGQGSVV